MAPTLLTLPLEVREYIYDQAIEGQSAFLAHCLTETNIRYSTFKICSRRYVRASSANSPDNSTSLLAICTQIRYEFINFAAKRLEFEVIDDGDQAQYCKTPMHHLIPPGWLQEVRRVSMQEYGLEWLVNTFNAACPELELLRIKLVELDVSAGHRKAPQTLLKARRLLDDIELELHYSLFNSSVKMQRSWRVQIWADYRCTNFYLVEDRELSAEDLGRLTAKLTETRPMSDVYAFRCNFFER